MQSLVSARIETSGDYLLTEATPQNVAVADGITVRLFESISTALPFGREVLVGTGATCEISGVIKAPADWKLRTAQYGRHSTLRVRLALAAKDGAKLAAGVLAQVVGTGNKADVKVLSLVASGAAVDLDGTVSILPGARQAEGYITQENVFLDETGTVRGIPGLLVKSDDVKAGHSARTERLSDARLFYLRSRGIPKDKARAMMLRDAVHVLFSGLDEAAREERVEDALGFVLGK